jgi:anion-transporting  ArsA/GET3 family ATPase
MASSSHSPDRQGHPARRFLFVTGKGGVGKTTVCAALALALARRGRRVLVAMSGPHERLSSFLGTPPIGHDVQEVARNVWATKIEPPRALEEYGELILKVKSLARAVFDNRYTQAFFRAVPGLYDWSLLGKAWYHTTEERPDGSPRFDVVLFDAPSTGHGLDMLRVPKVILDIVPPGALRRDAERAWQLFSDPVRSGVVLVSLPEEMPVTETVELAAALHGEIGMPLLSLVINGRLEPLFDASEREALLVEPDLVEAVAHWCNHDAFSFARMLASVVRCAARERIQAECVARLEREVAMPTTVLPFLLEGAGTPTGIAALSQRF